MANSPIDPALVAEQLRLHMDRVRRLGIVHRPNADQLLEMDEACQAHRRRWALARRGAGSYRPLR